MENAHKPPYTIRLDKVEAVLRRENSCIAEQDVAILMAAIYEEAGVETPARLLQEAEANNGA